MSELLFAQQDVDFINATTHTESDRLCKMSILARVFSVIPLHRSSIDSRKIKSPTEENWQQYCVSKRIFKEEDFKDRNAGIACGMASNIIVLDIDDHDEFPLWLKSSGIELHPPETFTVKSGGKSLHLYYKYPSKCDKGVVYGCRSKKTESKNTIFDIKGVGGQVVAPGSIHPNGGMYTILKNLPIREAPPWILELAKRDSNQKNVNKLEAVHKGRSLDQSVNNVDILGLPISAEQKINILKRHPVGTRSEAEMSVICCLVRARIDENTILAIFEDSFYPIGEKHRESGSRRIERLYGQIEKAKKLVSVESDPKELKLMSLGSIIDIDPKLEYLVEGLWTVNDTLMLFGVGGTGKSLFALNLAIALTDPSIVSFMDKFPVKKKCNVLLLQSEVSMSGFNDRVKKIYRDKILPTEVRERIKIVSISDDIMTSGDFNNDKFFEIIKKILTENNQDVLIIDPLISFHNEDENANTQMRRVLDRIKILGQETKTSVLIIHHSGKSNLGNNNSGGRGASSIGDWASSSIELKVKDKGRDIYELVHRKSRDFKEFGSIVLRRTESLEFKLTETTGIDLDSHDKIVLKSLNALGDTSVNQKMLAEKICELAPGKDGKSISRNTAIKWIKDAIEHSAVKTEHADKMQRIVPCL